MTYHKTNSKDLELVKASNDQLDDHDSSEEAPNASDENTVGMNRAFRSNIKIPEDVRKTYDAALDESQDLKAIVAHIEKCIPKAAKSRKKELKCKLRKARHSSDLLIKQIEDLKIKHPSLDRDAQSHVESENEPEELPEQRQDSPIDTVRMTDETLLRKNHWPDLSVVRKPVPKCFIYVDSDDDELVQFELVDAPTKRKTNQSRVGDLPKAPDPVADTSHYSGHGRPSSQQILEDALRDWKEYCRMQDFADDCEEYGRYTHHRRYAERNQEQERKDQPDEPTHSSINVINNYRNFSDFYQRRLESMGQDDNPGTRNNQNSSTTGGKGSNVRFHANDMPSFSGDVPRGTSDPQEHGDAQDHQPNTNRTDHHPRRDDDHQSRNHSRHRRRRRDSSDDEDDYSREPRTKHPPPNQFEALPCDNIRMFIKQYERFAQDKRYPVCDYYMNAIKYLGVKVKTLMNRWTQESLEDWDRVKTYLIKTYEIMDSKQASIKEFHRKTQLPNESYRDHMRTLTSLKMTGWPEEYAHCTSDNVKEPFNSSLMDQFLTTCKNRSVAIAVERLHAEKQAMGTPLTIENIITYSENLSESRFASGMTKIPTPDSCKICRSSKHTTKECVLNKKINQLQGHEYEDDEESDEDQQSDQELNAVDAPHSNNSLDPLTRNRSITLRNPTS